MNYRITGDFRVPFRTESLAFEQEGLEESTPSQHMQNRMTEAWLRHCTTWLPHTYDFRSEDISICRAASAVQDRDYHQGHLYQVETRSCKMMRYCIVLPKEARGSLSEFVRRYDLPLQSYGSMSGGGRRWRVRFDYEVFRMFRYHLLQATQLHVCCAWSISKKTPRLHHRSEQIFLSRTMVAMSRSSACCPRLSRREMTEMERWKRWKRWKSAKKNAKESCHAFFLVLNFIFQLCIDAFRHMAGPVQAHSQQSSDDW